MKGRPGPRRGHHPCGPSAPPWRHHPHRGPPWRRHHPRGSDALPPGGWRLARAVFSRLHRRLFWGFGFSIAISAAVAWILHATLAPSGKAPLVSIGVGLLLLWGMAGAISRAITRPLLELVKVTREIGEGRLDSRMRLGRFAHGEVGLIAQSVNDMARRIEQQIADQRELLAAVSHELRTPLGHMRVLVDTARDEGGASSTVGELDREIVEMDRLVDRLLARSRLEFGPLQMRDVDLAALAVRALERSGVDASRLEIETDETTVQGDPTLLLAAMSNLVENAEHHGRGLLRMEIARQGSTIRVEVVDAGPGLPAEGTERLFESFVRGDGREGGSLGLGLALVRNIATAHGGEAWARDEAAGGARVGFSLPTPG